MGFKASSRHGTRTTAEVDLWISKRQQAALMLSVRKAILSADPRITECIKWSCPTFVFEGNIVSINPAAKNFVSLMFHTGGKIPDRLPQLEGTGATCKYMRIDGAAGLKAKRADLQEVIRAWCAWKS
jgi:hypothetical protein